MVKAASDATYRAQESTTNMPRPRLKSFMAPGKVPETDGRLASAHMPAAKILLGLARIEERREQKDKIPLAERKSRNLNDEADALGSRGATTAITTMSRRRPCCSMPSLRFTTTTNSQAWSSYVQPIIYAGSVIANLPADNKDVELEGFNNYVNGAYFILALKGNGIQSPRTGSEISR